MPIYVDAAHFTPATHIAGFALITAKLSSSLRHNTLSSTAVNQRQTFCQMLALALAVLAARAVSIDHKAAPALVILSISPSQEASSPVLCPCTGNVSARVFESPQSCSFFHFPSLTPASRTSLKHCLCCPCCFDFLQTPPNQCHAVSPNPTHPSHNPSPPPSPSPSHLCLLCFPLPVLSI